MGHHYVPSRYLAGFTRDDRLWGFRKPSGQSFKTQRESIANERKLYSEELENRLNNEIEHPANALLPKITQRAQLDAADREALAMYIVTIWKRVPTARARVLDISPGVVDEVTDELIQDLHTLKGRSGIAVDTALRDELTSSVRQHIYTSEPQEQWNFPEKLADKRPQVHMYSFGDARREVTVDLKADHVLEDVHLHVLKWVAMRWAKRAGTQAPDANGTPTLAFPPRLGCITAGELVLCAVRHGPGLTRLERVAVRSAFWLRRARRERLSLSTRKMLEEIGAEVLTAAEGRRANMAIDRFKEMNRLHRTLLAACALTSAGESGESAATIRVSPQGWQGTTFDREWLRPYYEISHIAVDGIDQDLRLFKSLPESTPTARLSNRRWIGS